MYMYSLVTLPLVMQNLGFFLFVYTSIFLTKDSVPSQISSSTPINSGC